jgi:hypothetical protein
MAQSLPTISASCADLIRASIFFEMMDCRVKPGNDMEETSKQEIAR